MIPLKGDPPVMGFSKTLTPEKMLVLGSRAPLGFSSLCGKGPNGDARGGEGVPIAALAYPDQVPVDRADQSL